MKPTIFRVAVILAFVLLIFPCEYATQAHAVNTVISVTLSTPQSTYSEGELIPVQYELRNVSKATLYCADKEQAVSFRFQLKNQQDQVVGQDKRLFAPPNPSGVRAINSLSPGDAVRGTLCADVGSWTKSPGKYVLQTNLQFLYERKDDSNATPFNASASLPLIITKRDPARLKAAAKSLRITALKNVTHDASEQQEAVKALFRMPEDMAFPYWENVLKNSSRDPRVTEAMTNQIAANATATSVKLLVGLWKNASGFEASATQDALLEIYRNGAEELRPRIKRAFIEHTGKTPESIPRLIPSNAD